MANYPTVQPTPAPPEAPDANKPGPDKEYNAYDRSVYELARVQAKIMSEGLIKGSIEMAQPGLEAGWIGTAATVDALKDELASREAKSGLPKAVDKKPADLSKGKHAL